MLRLLDRVVGSFSVIRLIMISLFIRLVTLFLLPSNPSFFAPDEGTYASLAYWVADSKDVDSFPDFGPTLYNTSKTLILPAVALIKIGFGELTAVRVVSIGFGILSVYLFAKILLLVLGAERLHELDNVKSQRIAFMGICVFAFMPSSLIWSTLGLRESASKAMTLAAVLLLLKLRDFDLSRGKIGRLKSLLPIWILGTLVISFSFGARRQTAIVFVAFYCLSLLLLSKGRNFFSLTSVVISGTLIGLTLSTTPITQETNVLMLSPKKQSEPVALESGLRIACDQEGEIYEIGSDEFVCSKITILKEEITITAIFEQAPLKNIDELETQRENNRIGAQTQLPETKCLSFRNLSIKNLACNLSELPYRLASILFRPLPFLDQGSLSNNLASAENIIWIMLFTLFAYSLVVASRNRIKLYLVVPTAIYVLAFVNLSALYEGNLGTAFRHKSTILWGLILVVTLVLSMNRTDFKEKNQKN